MERILLEAKTYTAKYRNGAGHVLKTKTGCRDRDAARAMLVQLEKRADDVRSGIRSVAEDAVLDHQATPLSNHVVAYLAQLRTKRGKGGKPRVSARHVANVKHCLERVISGCRFELLRDLDRDALERWADQQDAAGMAARTLNAHLSALSALSNWCVKTGRITFNPFARPPKRDEKADCRRPRRALNADELRRLLRAAQLRPLAEYGRPTVRLADAAERANRRSRRTWTKAPLTADVFDAAVVNARKVLAEQPDFIAELEQRGRERALIYKTLVLTGLRKGELASLTVGRLELNGVAPCAILAAADDKAGRGAEIALRPDLVDDLRSWLSKRLAAARKAARVEGSPLPAQLPADTPLFHIPADLVRIFDLDLLAAGLARRVPGRDRKGRECWRIDKRDARGRTLDIHALRHTFATHLSKGGVAPRTAQAAMRHSKLELTMNTYTDPRLLDVAGALGVLPSLPLDGDRPNAEQRLAAGAEDVCV
ncbi:MAG TPA: tyrosine-type recombinase/integrase, partial [Phycisphaerae bacterium]|nr:tyrosine-type recombinase/integrase [Phycisphaerae bacterium]